MGRNTQLKNAKAEADKARADTALRNGSRAHEERRNQVIDYLPSFLHIFEDFEDQFIRSPVDYQFRTKSADPHKQFLELARYAFGKFPVNAFLNQAWAVSGKHPIAPMHESKHFRQHFHHNIDNHRAWYVCLATGGSLYKQYMKGTLTRAETHFFATQKNDITIPQAIILAIAKGYGATESTALRIARSKITDQAVSPFWRDCIQVLSRFTFTKDVVVDDIADYLIYQHRQPNNNFTIVGQSLTLDGLLKRVDSWHRALARMRIIGESKWQGIPVADKTYTVTKDDKEVSWHFEQITTASRLQQEGNKMRHCVYSYKFSAARGDLSIWSLGRTNEYGHFDTKVTIELRSGGYIAQARGVGNRPTNTQEANIIGRWAREHGFRWY